MWLHVSVRLRRGHVARVEAVSQRLREARVWFIVQSPHQPWLSLYGFHCGRRVGDTCSDFDLIILEHC